MIKRALGVLLVLLVGYLLVWPTPIEPKAWDPSAYSELTGAYAPNERLKGVEWWAKGLVGGEAIAFDPDGNLVTGLRDGRVVKLAVGSDTPVELVNTHGRPLGLMFHPDGRLIICDAHKGLLALGKDGVLETLADREGGVPFALTDDLDIGEDGTIYFTDASARFTVEQFTFDILEHQTTGRVLAWDPATRAVTRIADGFSFANGLALGPDPEWAVVAEMSTYQLWKVWVKGAQKGKKELFTNSLPGFPDNIRYSKSRHVFWVAIGSPRNPLIDQLAGKPWVRTVISRLPAAIQPKPERIGFALAVDEQGKPVQSLQYRAPDSYSPVSSVIERDGWIYLGSFAREGVARAKVE